LKKKNQELRRQRQADKQRGRVHILLNRRSRSAVALAKAIRQSQSFQYVDYYGYRY